ncbi:flavin reductase family protein [Nocardia nova]|uniref:flavin reductase family protein n=1 Tax=Nocardia nova TaxID=37330 RepID=UPI0033FE0CE9
MTPIEKLSLRACLGRFTTGVAVVSFESGSGPRGVTVNSFTSVSIDPPLVLVSVARRARSHDTMRKRPFCVNVLAAEQENLALVFAGASTHGDAEPIPWVADTPIPRLHGALSWLQCRPWREYDGGDHTLFIGEIDQFGYRDGTPLAFHASAFTRVVQHDVGIEELL